MLLLAVFAFQATSALSSALPHDERLRFVFVRDDRSNARVSGTLATPTKWSRSAFVEIVERCGGERLGVARSNGYLVVVTSESSASNLAVARCVKASTSVRFWVGTGEQGVGAVPFDQQPFRELWDS